MQAKAGQLQPSLPTIQRCVCFLIFALTSPPSPTFFFFSNLQLVDRNPKCCFHFFVDLERCWTRMLFHWYGCVPRRETEPPKFAPRSVSLIIARLYTTGRPELPTKKKRDLALCRFLESLSTTHHSVALDHEVYTKPREQRGPERWLLTHRLAVITP